MAFPEPSVHFAPYIFNIIMLLPIASIVFPGGWRPIHTHPKLDTTQGIVFLSKH